jgi:uncharacterized CHY-type Zn-finger protein
MLPPELINRVASFIDWRTDLARLLRDKRALVSRCGNCGSYLEIERFEQTDHCPLCDRWTKELWEKSERLARYRATWNT